jgi:hypothetical protein
MTTKACEMTDLGIPTTEKNVFADRPEETVQAAGINYLNPFLMHGLSGNLPFCKFDFQTY